MTAWIALGAAIVMEVTGSLALSAAGEQPLWYLLVVAGYLGAFSLLPQALKRGMSIGAAYGIWGGAGVGLAAVLSAVLFGDPLTPTMMLGLLLIIGGVAAIELGRHRASVAAGAVDPTGARSSTRPERAS